MLPRLTAPPQFLPWLRAQRSGAANRRANACRSSLRHPALRPPTPFPRSYSMVLRSQPFAAVTIGVLSTQEVDASPPAITFSDSDWSDPQEIVLSAVDDDLSENVHGGTHQGGIVTHLASSSDPSYHGYYTSLGELLFHFEGDNRVCADADAGMYAVRAAAYGRAGLLLVCSPLPASSDSMAAATATGSSTRPRWPTTMQRPIVATPSMDTSFRWGRARRTNFCRRSWLLAGDCPKLG